MTSPAETTSRVVLACGGTGGHLFPGLAVADEFSKRGVTVTLMVSAKEVDQRAVRAAHPLRVATLPAVALQRGSRLAFLRGVLRSARLSLGELRRERPVALLAMGGFTSAGPALAARLLRIPVFLHESNTIPGRANRWLSGLATGVFVGFPSAAARFRRPVMAVGTPVRALFSPAAAGDCRRRLGLDPERPVVLVAGGSQGARPINDIILRALPGAKSMLPHWQWAHLTGPADEARVRAAYVQEGVDAVVHGFWDRMDSVLGAASCAVARAGASFMAELAAMRVPSVLVPLPHSADDHQFHNACAFESTGAAVLIEQDDLRPENLLSALRPMVEDADVRDRMQSALEPWHRPEAADAIARQVLSLAGRSGTTLDARTPEAAPLRRSKALVS